MNRPLFAGALRGNEKIFDGVWDEPDLNPRAKRARVRRQAQRDPDFAACIHHDGAMPIAFPEELAAYREKIMTRPYELLPRRPRKLPSAPVPPPARGRPRKTEQEEASP
jgi:hypothetical protein